MEGDHVFALPYASCLSTFQAPGWGIPAVFPPRRWRNVTPWELVPLSHRSASRIFISQPGCTPPPAVTRDGDHQPLGGEKQAGLRSWSHPQLQGCSSSSLGWKASRVGVLPSTWAGDLLLPPAFGGEGRSPALRRRRTATCCPVGVWLSVHRTGDCCAVCRSGMSAALPRC